MGLFHVIYFNLYIDPLLVQLSNSGYGYHIAGVYAGALSYADLLVVSLHQSDPLSDTLFCDSVVNHEIIKRACLSQQRALEEMLHRLIGFFTFTRGVILICIIPLS